MSGSGSKGLVLLVGPWGFPGRWYGVSYRAPKLPDEASKWGKLSAWGSEGPVRKGHSTTLALAGALEDQGWEVRMLVYGLDTLASPYFANPKAVGSDLAGRLEALLEEFHSSDPRSYEEVLERAQAVLGLFLDAYAEEAGVDRGKVECLILPGTGRWMLPKPGARGDEKPYSYVGSPLNMQALLELHLTWRLGELKPDAIILDISHGVNYMPALALRALERVSVLHASLRGPISVAVVQSDPVAEGSKLSVIHVVEAGRVGYSIHDAMEYFAGSLPRDPRGIHGYRMLERGRPPSVLKGIKAAVEGALEEYWGTMKTVIAADRHGLALYALHALSTVNPARLRRSVEALEDLLRGALRYREVGRSEEGVLVSQPFAIIPGEALNILYSLRILEALASQLETQARTVGRYRMFSLSSLRRYLERVEPPRAARAIAQREIDDVKGRVTTLLEALQAEPSLLSKPTSYSVIYDYTERSFYSISRAVREGRVRSKLERGIQEDQYMLEKKPPTHCDIDERNFYAHAGMERNAVAVLAVEGEVYIGYHPHCLDRVRELASEALS
ncbi:MAG: CRISPR-associated DxTHG motif protein [Desulfurococcales archaeon]|nr:CRISPR-associated DxTHG motif protein [Desulfurococcales archaeon]